MNFRTLDLNLLRVFDAVMHERSLTRAAQTLSMSQSAVSHALKRLRSSVGEDLFTRTRHGVGPTARGQALWPSIRAALNSIQQAFVPGAFDPQAEPMAFRLAMADATAALLMPPLLADIAQALAHADLRMVPLLDRDPRPLLELGEADVALGYFPAAVGAVMTQGEHTPWRRAALYHSEYRCVMRRNHPLAKGALTLERYCAAQHVLVSFSGHAQGIVDEALARLGRTRRIALTVNQFFTAAQVAAESDLVTVLPASFMAASGHAGQLVTRPLPLPLDNVQVNMHWHARHDDEPAHAWLRQRVIEAAQPDRIARRMQQPSRSR